MPLFQFRDERFNILYQGLTSSYLKIFPRPDDDKQRWYSNKSELIGFSSEDSTFAAYILGHSFDLLVEGKVDQALKDVEYIRTFQSRYAADLIPSQSRINTELNYNKWQLFKHLFYSFWMVGFFLLLIALLKRFYHNKVIISLDKLLKVLSFILFLAHIVGPHLISVLSYDTSLWLNL